MAVQKARSLSDSFTVETADTKERHPVAVVQRDAETACLRFGGPGLGI